MLGIQGYGLPGYPRFSLANTGCKHFSAFNGPENWGSPEISDQDWFMNYLPQFERCLDAGSYSVMCSYSTLNGISNCANERAMQTVLRDTWGLSCVAKNASCLLPNPPALPCLMHSHT